MKRKWMKQILAAAILGTAFMCGTGYMAEAYYADASSAVYLGTDQSGHRYSAVNVVDDDSTVYTIYYRFRPGTDDIVYRISGEEGWHGWPVGLHVTYSHMELLAQQGMRDAIRIAS